MGRDRSMDKIKHGHVDAFICRCMVENFLALGVISWLDRAIDNCFRRKFA